MAGVAHGVPSKSHTSHKEWEDGSGRVTLRGDLAHPGRIEYAHIGATITPNGRYTIVIEYCKRGAACDDPGPGR